MCTSLTALHPILVTVSSPTLQLHSPCRDLVGHALPYASSMPRQSRSLTRALTMLALLWPCWLCTGTGLLTPLWPRCSTGWPVTLLLTLHLGSHWGLLPDTLAALTSRGLIGRTLQGCRPRSPTGCLMAFLPALCHGLLWSLVGHNHPWAPPWLRRPRSI